MEHLNLDEQLQRVLNMEYHDVFYSLLAENVTTTHRDNLISQTQYVIEPLSMTLVHSRFIHIFPFERAHSLVNIRTVINHSFISN